MYCTCLRVYVSTIYLQITMTCLTFNHSQSLRQNFKTCLAQIASKARINFPVCVDVKREVGGEFEGFEFTHADLLEAHVCAFEEFGYKTEHGGTGNFADGEKFHFAVIIF
jgi:hypothetical protein